MCFALNMNARFRIRCLSFGPPLAGCRRGNPPKVPPWPRGDSRKSNPPLSKGELAKIQFSLPQVGTHERAVPPWIRGDHRGVITPPRETKAACGCWLV
jgi:hypothetical protein